MNIKVWSPLMALFLAWPVSAQEWSALSVRAEAERIRALGIGFPDAGNAAELYLPYLRGEAKVTAEAWFHEVTLAMVVSPAAGDAEKLARAVELAGADIAAVAAGSRRSECRVGGVYYEPEPDRALFSQDSPAYVMLYRMGALMAARADRHSAANQPGPARELLLAVIRLGHHLEHEPDLFAYVAGLALKETAAKRLVAAPGPDGERFRPYAAATSERIAVKNQVLRQLPDWDRGRVERLVLDPDAPYALRFDTLTARHYCLHDETILVRCALAGAPGWVRRLEGEFAEQDELSRRFVEVMQAHRAELKWLK